MRAAAVLGLFSLALAAQVPFQREFDELPVPEQDLHALRTDEFTTFKHPAFPKHSVRIKKLDDLCDNGSK